jgi:hypothetical protein
MAQGTAGYGLGVFAPNPDKIRAPSPYFMVYDAKAVIPADIAFQSPRVESFNKDMFDES